MDFMLLNSLLHNSSQDSSTSRFRVVPSSVLLSLKVITIVLQALRRRTRQLVGVFLITFHISITLHHSSLACSQCGRCGIACLPAHKPQSSQGRRSTMGIHKGSLRN